MRGRSCGLIVLFATLFSLGCGSAKRPFARTATELSEFGPSAMRIHPIFTRLKDWTGDGKPDGVEVLLELQDQFGDPTKASGRVIFELYTFQKFDPERRGERVCNPWADDLQTVEEQRNRWNRTSRTYSFPLESDQINANRSYVLTAQFELSGGGRLFDQIVLEPPAGAYAAKEAAGARTSTNASTQPINGGGAIGVTTQPSTQGTGGPAIEPGQRTPAP